MPPSVDAAPPSRRCTAHAEVAPCAAYEYGEEGIVASFEKQKSATAREKGILASFGKEKNVKNYSCQLRRPQLLRRLLMNHHCGDVLCLGAPGRGSANSSPTLELAMHDPTYVQRAQNLSTPVSSSEATSNRFSVCRARPSDPDVMIFS